MRSKIWHEVTVGMVFVQISFIISEIVFAHTQGSNFESLSHLYILNIGIDTMALLESTIMYTNFIRNKLRDKTTAIFMALLMVNSFLLYIDALFWMLDGKAEYRTINIAVPDLQQSFCVT